MLRQLATGSPCTLQNQFNLDNFGKHFNNGVAIAIILTILNDLKIVLARALLIIERRVLALTIRVMGVNFR